MQITHPRALIMLCALTGLSACSAPPTPLILDGRHRVPVNTAQARAAYEAAQATPALKTETGQ